MAKSAKRTSILGATNKLREMSQEQQSADQVDTPSPAAKKKPETTFDVMTRQGAKKMKPGTLTHLVEPEACVMWEHADRHVEGLDKDSLLELGNSILHNKQLAPAVARRVSDEVREARGLPPEIRFEIIAGRRRFEACKLVKTDLLISIQNVDDATAFSIMVAENDDREDIKPFTRALSFKAALSAGIYTSQSDLARHQEKEHSTKSYDRTTINRMVKAASLSDRDWLWSQLSSLDYASLPISICHQLESWIEEGDRVEAALKEEMKSYKGTDAVAIIKHLHKLAQAILTKPKPTPEPTGFKAGDYTVDLDITKKGAKLQVKGGPLTKDTLDDLLASIREHILEKIS
jgi:ParB/RepB/Spo0J family partition protein